jgi:hypothetical protein
MVVMIMVFVTLFLSKHIKCSIPRMNPSVNINYEHCVKMYHFGREC